MKTRVLHLCLQQQEEENQKMKLTAWARNPRQKDEKEIKYMKKKKKFEENKEEDHELV